MSKNEEIYRFAINNLALEGMTPTEKEKQTLRDCISGKRKYKDAIAEVITQYSIKGAR